MSLRELARRAGLSPSLVAFVAAGTRRPTPDVVAKLAAALDAVATDARELARVLRRS